MTDGIFLKSGVFGKETSLVILVPNNPTVKNVRFHYRIKPRRHISLTTVVLTYMHQFWNNGTVVKGTCLWGLIRYGKPISFTIGLFDTKFRDFVPFLKISISEKNFFTSQFIHLSDSTFIRTFHKNFFMLLNLTFLSKK